MTTTALCPRSGARARAVPHRTVAALLQEGRRPGPGPFYFCPDGGCPVVYFDRGRGEIHVKRDLVVRVGCKETRDPVPLCYCFDFTRAMIRDEIARTGDTTIPARIRKGIAEGRCACEIKNPQGSCCLGDVTAAVREAQKETR